METYQIIVLALFCALVLLEILFTNFFNKHKQRPKDGVVEFIGFFQLNFLALPLVFGFGYGHIFLVGLRIFRLWLLNASRH